MAGLTIPQRISYIKIISAINTVGKYGKSAIGEELGVRHSAIIYRLKTNPLLGNYFKLTYKLEKLKEEIKAVKKLEHILRKSRKNPPFIELYKPAGIDHDTFFDYIKKYDRILGKLFDSLYDGSRKMKKETVENIEKRIKRKPAGTKVCKIWPGVNVSDYLRNNHELEETYVNKNGKIRVGKPRKQLKIAKS